MYSPESAADRAAFLDAPDVSPRRQSVSLQLLSVSAEPGAAEANAGRPGRADSRVVSRTADGSYDISASGGGGSGGPAGDRTDGDADA